MTCPRRSPIGRHYGGITRSIRPGRPFPRPSSTTPGSGSDSDGRIAVDRRSSSAGRRRRELPVRIRLGAHGAPGPRPTARPQLDRQPSPPRRAPQALVARKPDALRRPRSRPAAMRCGDRIGFRTIEVRGAPTSCSTASRSSCAVSRCTRKELGKRPGPRDEPRRRRARLFTEIKQGLHGNFVRPQLITRTTKATTRLADEMGLLVWSEVPVYWPRRLEQSGHAGRRAPRCCAENIRRDRNRAAIILWSVANETPVSDARNAFLAHADRRCPRAGSTAGWSPRPCSARARARVMPIDVIRSSNDLDVMAINTYNGWYSRRPASPTCPASTGSRPGAQAADLLRIRCRRAAPAITTRPPLRTSSARNIRPNIIAARSRMADARCRSCAAMSPGSSRTSARRAASIRFISRAGTARSLISETGAAQSSLSACWRADYAAREEAEHLRRAQRDPPPPPPVPALSRQRIERERRIAVFELAPHQRLVPIIGLERRRQRARRHRREARLDLAEARPVGTPARRSAAGSQRGRSPVSFSRARAVHDLARTMPPPRAPPSVSTYSGRSGWPWPGLGITQPHAPQMDEAPRQACCGQAKCPGDHREARALLAMQQHASTGIAQAIGLEHASGGTHSRGH